jgi:tetratricopeptide (TPR) repeat protein
MERESNLGCRVDRTGLVKTLLLTVVLLGCVACAAPATERAQSLVRQHREEEAVAVLRKRLTAHPDDVAARKLLVRVLGLVGDLPAAHAEVAELAGRLPAHDPSPAIELGHALELSHRYDEALAEYDEAAAVAPESPAGPLEGGLRCARWGEIRDALPRLEEAVRRGARDASTWHALGLVRLHLGDLDGAEEAYRAGAAADPSQLENLLGLATVAVVRGSGEAALVAYDAILARSPRHAPAVLGRAWALARLGRIAEARAALDLAEQLGAPRDNVARQRAALDAPAPTESSGTR